MRRDTRRFWDDGPNPHWEDPDPNMVRIEEATLVFAHLGPNFTYTLPAPGAWQDMTHAFTDVRINAEQLATTINNNMRIMYAPLAS